MSILFESVGDVYMGYYPVCIHVRSAVDNVRGYGDTGLVPSNIALVVKLTLD